VSEYSALEIARQLVPDIFVEPQLSASEFVEQKWLKYKSNYPDDRGTNGKVFEELIAMTLIRQGIMPFYIQAEISFIPNVKYDFVIYSEEIGPIVLSAKTSLRERYKQAELEAMVLKNIHRKSKSYVISMDVAAIKVRKKNIDSLIAINNFILATSQEYDSFLEDIKTYTIKLAPIIPIVKSNFLISSPSDRY
jgi:hypothetical protein